MNTKSIDTLNIFLIVIALLVAIKIPFELFLISYAILGPLHYLTEINWLNEQSFFIRPSKKWMMIFILAALIISILPLLTLVYPDTTFLKQQPYALIAEVANVSIIFSFLLAFGLVLITKEKMLSLVVLFCLIAGAIIFFFLPGVAIFLIILVPTLIHVYLFTLLFMIFGYKQKKSTPTLVSILALVVVPFFIFGLTIQPQEYATTNWAKTSFMESNMLIIHNYVVETFSLVAKGNYSIMSELGIKIQIFIAFAYTYHYLNWFTKTSIIGWSKNLTKKKSFFILAIWITSVCIYMYNYKLGFTILFFLSFLHVFMEFPLNVRSIIGLLKFK